MRALRPLLAPVLLAVLVLVGGCGSAVPGRAVVAPVAADDLALIRLHLARLNAAGQEGVARQVEFLRATQEPSAPMPPPECYGAETVEVRLVERTLKPAPGQVPIEVERFARPPDGAVYVAALSLTTLSTGIPVRYWSDVSQFVVRDGRVYGYAPCLR